MSLSVNWQAKGRALGMLVMLMLACSALASASATLLLEEPYGALGFFTATGHAAVYLSGVCAETPLILRPCAPGETGVVLSRYDGVRGYDWVAIPLIPYLYAVDRPESVPLFADAKMTAFLRDTYRRRYLEDIAPDSKNGGMPGGNWYELVGSSYDRTIYGFEIETTPQQDAALIQKLNSSPNISHFHLVTHNCADFAKDIINFYYPRALHRSIIADVGMTTPKQMAKTMIKYSSRHPKLQFSRIVIAQVPGGMPRSSTVHGVVESFFRSKKYIVPSAVVSPIFAGCVAAVYVATGAGHFEPARNAMVFVVGGEPEAPVDREDLKAYQAQLKHYLDGTYPEKSAQRVDKSWERLQSHAKTAVDAEGSPILQVQVGGDQVRVGATADNVLSGNAPPQLVRQLLEARLESELHRSPRQGISETEVARDWDLLQKTFAESDPHITARSGPRSESTSGNRP
ncbi:MAG TPA: hypothetical protein VE377_04885 [Candidatus Dormibacteraeota bacterium]|nr:hypothetical protein [Candidatus Dormibacteraeota bacterium]